MPTPGVYRMMHPEEATPAGSNFWPALVALIVLPLALVGSCSIIQWMGGGQ